MSTAPREDRSFRNVVQLAIEFFFIFFAFLSCGYVEETVINNFAAAGANISKHDGYMSLSIIYVTLTLGSLIAPLIVALLNAKWAMVSGGSAYLIFQCGFLFLNRPFLYGSSALLGVGGSGW